MRRHVYPVLILSLLLLIPGTVVVSQSEEPETGLFLEDQKLAQRYAQQLEREPNVLSRFRGELRAQEYFAAIESLRALMGPGRTRPEEELELVLLQLENRQNRLQIFRSRRETFEVIALLDDADEGSDEAGDPHVEKQIARLGEEIEDLENRRDSLALEAVEARIELLKRALGDGWFEGPEGNLAPDSTDPEND